MGIDKINNAREETLCAIEGKKRSDTTALVVVDTVKEAQHTELMRQRLNHLDMPLSRVTKNNWLGMVHELSIYYPEDQRKIIRHGIKKGESWFCEMKNKVPFRIFYENLDMKNPEVHMSTMLKHGLRLGCFGDQASCLVPDGSPLGVLDYVRQFYMSADGATPEGADEYIVDMIRECSQGCRLPFEYAMLYRDYLLKKLPSIEHILDKYTGDNARLSCLLKDTVTIEEKTERHRGLLDSIIYDSSIDNYRGGWRVKPIQREKVEITVLEYFLQIFFSFNRKLFHYDGYWLKGEDRNKLSVVNYRKDPFERENIDMGLGKYLPIFQRICDFIPSIEIDRETLGCMNTPAAQRLVTYYSEKVKLCDFFRYKFCQGMINESEIRILYTDPDFHRLLMSTHPGGSSGFFRERDDFVEAYLPEATEMFDFASDDDMKQYFGHLVKKNYPTERIIEKLSQERPHEYALLREYFTVAENQYKDVEIYERFQGCSSMELFLLAREGVDVGKVTAQSGVKVGDKVLPAEEARSKFIIEYYKNFYKDQPPTA